MQIARKNEGGSGGGGPGNDDHHEDEGTVAAVVGGGTSRKTWTARRSFFKRRKGGRSSSRDPNQGSKELASYSDVASLSYAAGDIMEPDPNPSVNSYVRVERLDCEYTFYFL